MKTIHSGWLVLIRPEVAGFEVTGDSVKRGELEAVLVHRGRRKGLRIKVPHSVPDLFNQSSINQGAV